MTRLASFFHHQRAAFRALFTAGRPHARRELPCADEPPHPSTLCSCDDAVRFADHRPDCPWIAVMCHACAGWGWCLHCAGSGSGVHRIDERTLAIGTNELPPLGR